MISIPIAFIFSRIYIEPSITTLEQVLEHLQKDQPSKDLHEWVLEHNQNMMILEMIRVHALNNNITPLFELYELWKDLGYDHNDKGVLIGFNEHNQPFNPKVSMILNHQICGIVAFCPLDVWNIAKKRKG